MLSTQITQSSALGALLSGSHLYAQSRQVSAVTSTASPPFLPNIPGSSVLISDPSGKLAIGSRSVRLRARRQIVVPDDVLLEIFDVYTRDPRAWHTLVHVCRRWRRVVFASTHRLNLQLRCTGKTPVRKMLDIWPALPIMIKHYGGRFSREEEAGNIAAALGHPDRVCQIEFRYPSQSDLDRFAAAMKEPFTELTVLDLRTICRNTVLVLPDSFLGGSAPRLQTLWFDGISFPAIPKLLSSASDLVTLRLIDIPHSGYISPEAMVTGLSALTRLQTLIIEFQSPRSRPGQPSSPPSIRTILPALNVFQFRGVSEYLEDLTSRIDAPFLRNLRVTFFNQLIFNTPWLSSFIGRAEELRSQSRARIKFYYDAVELSHTIADRPGLKLMILCQPSDWQLSSLTQVCDYPFLSFFNLERLEICEALNSRPDWQEDVENIQWLELLRPFTTVKRLSLSVEITPLVVRALQELSGERIMDVLPALQSIFIPGTSLLRPVKEALAQFLTVRRLSGRPVAVNLQ